MTDGNIYKETVSTNPQMEAGSLPEGSLLPNRGTWIGLSVTWYVLNMVCSPICWASWK